ncbi:hypothetical protein [Photobacterium rosenbergii]|uniref:hypothetical protein n=1 Tax=Photobacterium rosenbergii TaxID=294936 RepID=UPI001C99608B|nr:hypothetical protein [Photobacterium rosenbergii]MBY5947436.1 hypothetical protein [Photobacterium rosenbergii]
MTVFFDEKEYFSRFSSWLLTIDTGLSIGDVKGLFSLLQTEDICNIVHLVRCENLPKSVEYSLVGLLSTYISSSTLADTVKTEALANSLRMFLYRNFGFEQIETILNAIAVESNEGE